MGVISVNIRDDFENLIDAIALCYEGNRSKAMNAILEAVFFTEKGEQLEVCFEGKKIMVSNLIKRGQQEIDLDDLRKYTDKPLHKNFVQNLSKLPHSLRVATFKFIMSVIFFIEKSGDDPYIGTAQNISIYGGKIKRIRNEKHLLYINITSYYDKVSVSRYMQFNRLDKQPENPYVWNEICRALDIDPTRSIGYYSNEYFQIKDIDASVKSITLYEKGLVKLYEHFTNL